MDGESDFDSTFGEVLDELSDGVLGLSGAQTVAGHDDDRLRVVHHFNRLQNEEE